MVEYDEEDYLMLSGIQHFVFCRRQWALIHIEQQWSENLRTVEGNIMHKKAHDGLSSEKRNDVIVSRGINVFSRSLGMNGICDVVEFHRDDEHGVELFGKEGKYTVCPIEYKRGKPKEDDADILQMAAQAMCLEEMLCCDISEGCIFYGETKRRLLVAIDEKVRERVRGMSLEMHQYYDKKYTPKVKTSTKCNACSIKDICVPKLCRERSVKDYIEQMIKEEAL